MKPGMTDQGKPVDEKITCDAEGHWVQKIGKVLIIWSDRDGGNILDVELLFSKHSGETVSDMVRDTEGYGFLCWLMEKRFLRRDVLDFIDLTVRDAEDHLGEDDLEMDFGHEDKRE